MPVLIGMEVVFAAMLGGFWLPARIGRACFRLLTAVVFLTCLCYVIDSFSTATDTSRFNALRALLIIGLPCLWYTVRGRFSLRPEADEDEPFDDNDTAPGHDTFEARLLQPDWPFYEQHLQRPAPAALRALYADPPWITATQLVYSDACTIHAFAPLNAQYEHPLLTEMHLHAIPIATNDYGDPIYLKPGALESDAVYLTHHDGGDTEVLADSVAEFVTRLQRVNGEDLDV